MRDSQKTRVYKWQEQAWRGRSTAIERYTATQLVRRLIPTGWINVKFSARRTATATAWYARGEISFPVPGKGLTVEVVLHEVAHIINREKYGLKVASHGPEFVGILMGLLEKYGYDGFGLRMLARVHGVRFHA